MESKLSQIQRNLSVICDKYQETENIHLFFSYYKDKYADRNKENELCIKLNTSNKLFNKVFIINESTAELDFLEKSNRIVVKNSSRPKFIDFFKYANENTSNDTINILINTDIVIGENFNNIKLKDNQMICLSRYDVQDDLTYKINVGGGSHDCWIWKGKITENVGDFLMGKFLCDGVLADQLAHSNYILKNPVLEMKIYHIHLTNVRTYTGFDVINGHRSGVKFSKNDGIFIEEDLYWDGYNENKSNKSNK